MPRPNYFTITLVIRTCSLQDVYLPGGRSTYTNSYVNFYARAFFERLQKQGAALYDTGSRPLLLLNLPPM